MTLEISDEAYFLKWSKTRPIYFLGEKLFLYDYIVKSSESDIFVAIPSIVNNTSFTSQGRWNQICGGLWIIMKIPKERLKKSKKIFIKNMEKIGHKVKICESFAEAKFSTCVIIKLLICLKCIKSIRGR